MVWTLVKNSQNTHHFPSSPWPTQPTLFYNPLHLRNSLSRPTIWGAKFNDQFSLFFAVFSAAFETDVDWLKHFSLDFLVDTLSFISLPHWLCLLSPLVVSPPTCTCWTGLRFSFQNSISSHSEVSSSSHIYLYSFWCQ